MSELCACGQPLHYRDPRAQAFVEGFIKRLGRDVRVVVEGRTYLIPRHYIALHGLTGAEAMGFPELQ